MNAASILDNLTDLGVSTRVEGNDLICRPSNKIPLELKPLIREHKAELIELLVGQPMCGNSLTPHERHQLSWECDPNSCICYRKFGEPFWCGGAPCRWVWPK